MYNSQNIANRIKTLSKTKGISLKVMLSDCQLGINTISQMSKGNDMLSKNLAKIADYLDCSVDYLLGRTDNPAVNKKAPSEDGAVVSLAAYDGSADTPAFSSQEKTDAAPDFNT